MSVRPVAVQFVLWECLSSGDKTQRHVAPLQLRAERKYLFTQSSGFSCINLYTGYTLSTVCTHPTILTRKYLKYIYIYTRASSHPLEFNNNAHGSLWLCETQSGFWVQHILVWGHKDPPRCPARSLAQLSESTHPDLSVLLSLLSLLPVSCLIYNEASQVPNLL